MDQIKISSQNLTEYSDRLYGAMKACNLKAIDAHYIINTLLINTIQYPHNTIKKCIYLIPTLHQEIATLMTNNKDKPWIVGNRMLDYANHSHHDLCDFLIKTALYEYKAHSKDCWLLYRSSDISQDSTIIGKNQHSLSYGSSFFSGYFNDKTACPFHISYYSNDYYVVYLNKAGYRKQELENALFFVPPITTINGMASSGEDFHPRSRVFSDKMPSGYYGLLKPEYLRTNTQKLTSMDSLETAFQDYRAQYSRLIKTDATQLHSKL